MSGDGTELVLEVIVIDRDASETRSWKSFWIGYKIYFYKKGPYGGRVQ